MAKKTTSAKQTNPVEIGSAFNLLGKSYDIVKDNWKLFLVVSIPTVLSSLQSLISSSKEDYSEVTVDPYTGLVQGAVISLVFLLAYLVLWSMMVLLHVKKATGKKTSLKELFNESFESYFIIKLIGLTILSVIIIAIGVLLLIVPGVIAFGRLIMAPYFLADNKEAGVIEAIKSSNSVSKKYPGKVWAVIGVSVLVWIGVIFASLILTLLGLIPVVGILFSIAAALLYFSVAFFFQLMLALRYQQLKTL